MKPLRVAVYHCPAETCWYAQGIDIWLIASGLTCEAAKESLIRSIRTSADLTYEKFGKTDGLLERGPFEREYEIALQVIADTTLAPKASFDEFSHEHLPFRGVIYFYLTRPLSEPED